MNLRIPLHGIPCDVCLRPAVALMFTEAGASVLHGRHACVVPDYRGPHAPEGSGGRPYDPGAIRHNRRKRRAA